MRVLGDGVLLESWRYSFDRGGAVGCKEQIGRRSGLCKSARPMDDWKSVGKIEPHSKDFSASQGPGREGGGKEEEKAEGKGGMPESRGS